MWSRAWARLRAHPWTPKAAKYTTGSVVATVLGQVTFLAVYGFGLAGTTGATLLAFAASAVPNYWFSRHWAWRRTGRPDLVRELLPYLATITLNLAVATLATGYAENQVAALTDSHAVRTAVVTLTYTATYGLLFLGKFLVFEYLLFGDRARAHRAERGRADDDSADGVQAEDDPDGTRYRAD
ncbi:MAG: GtrA family protein [Actinomycetes bacterium]